MRCEHNGQTCKFNTFTLGEKTGEYAAECKQIILCEQPVNVTYNGKK